MLGSNYQLIEFQLAAAITRLAIKDVGSISFKTRTQEFESIVSKQDIPGNLCIILLHCIVSGFVIFRLGFRRKMNRKKVTILLHLQLITLLEPTPPVMKFKTFMHRKEMVIIFCPSLPKLIPKQIGLGRYLSHYFAWV